MRKYRALLGAHPSPRHILCRSEREVFLLGLLNLGQDLQPLRITHMLCRLRAFTGATERPEGSRGSKAGSMQDVQWSSFKWGWAPCPAAAGGSRRVGAGCHWTLLTHRAGVKSTV